VYGAADDFAQCLASVLEHTPQATKIVVADDASPGPQIERHLDNLAATGTTQHDVLYVKRTTNRGFVGNVNGAFAETDPADVVVVNSDVIVGPGWLDGLTHAAQQDPTVATVSTLTNHGTIVSLPRRNSPASAPPPGMTAAEAAQRVRDTAQRTHPRLPTAIGHCMLIRRQAIELVGPFDEAFSPGYGEEVDFSQRCVLQGLKHVLADDVFVLHRAGVSFGPGNPVQQEHEREIARRYPHYHPWVANVSEQRGGPFARALATGRKALTELSVTIDGTALNEDVAGTQVQTMEVIRGVHGAGIHPRVVVVPQLGEHWRHELESLDGVTLVPIAQAADEPPTAIVHRPFQVTAGTQLDFLHRLGERVIVTHQDLIAFQNPAYFDGYDEWHAYRQATAKAMAIADVVVFISNHVAAEAMAEEIVEDRQVRIVPNGTDHRPVGEATTPARPEGVEPPFTLCLGVDFRHKNRVFAMELQREMRARGWTGSLVLAGPRAQHGSSGSEERAWLAQNPAAADTVVTLNAVSEAEKQWLYENTELVLYPTTQEGFGLVPFEAARAGKPCLFAAQTSLAEVLPPEAARIVQWNAGLTAENAMTLITDEAERTQQIESILAAGERYSWARTGEQLAAVYSQALAAPMRPARAVIFEGDGADAKPTYPPAVEQALATIAGRPRLRRTVFGSMTALQKGARGLRRLAAQRR
jgi:GT2 family glycosyltransferase/glycosyltransferase involved in cell wall biosynthesis